MIYSVFYIDYCILTHMSSSHYIKHRNIIQPNDPRKTKETTMMHSDLRPKKKKHSLFTNGCCATALCEELLTVNETTKE